MKCCKRFWSIILALLLFIGCIFCFSGCSINKWAENRYNGTEKEMFAKVIDEFITALDEQNAEAIKVLFAPNVVENNPQIDDTIQQLFEFYPGNTEGNDWDENFGGSYSNHYGSHESQIESPFAIFSDGTAYYCKIALMYENDDDRGEIGVQYVDFVSEKVVCSEGFKWPDVPGLTLIENVGGDYQTRRIGGYPVKFSPVERTISENELVAFVSNSTSYSKFFEKFGVANATYVLESYKVYEVVMDSGENRYAVLWLNYPDGYDEGQISRIEIMNNEETLFYLWRADET